MEDFYQRISAEALSCAEDYLVEMEDKLSRTFGVNGTWKELIEKVMDFPESLPTQIRDIWVSNLEIAASKGAQVYPDEFAMAFVDQNFA